jgi:hypothetical protein
MIESGVVDNIALIQLHISSVSCSLYSAIGDGVFSKQVDGNYPFKWVYYLLVH